MKRGISCFLALLMTFMLFVPSFAAGESNVVYPTLYLEGQGFPLYTEDLKHIYSLDVDWIPYITQGDNIKTLLTDVALMDYDKYAEDLYNIIAPVYEEVVLDENGEASDGSGIRWNAYGNAVYSK